MDEPQRLSVDTAHTELLRTVALAEMLDEAETFLAHVSTALGELEGAMADLRTALAKLS